MKYLITWIDRENNDMFQSVFEYHEARLTAIRISKKIPMDHVTVSCIEDTGLNHPEIVGQWVIADGLQRSMEGKIK